MAEFSQMIRWNAGFVRGLAESVLQRAKVIRSSLGPSTPAVGPSGVMNSAAPATKPARAKAAQAGTRAKSKKSKARKRAAKARSLKS